MSLTYEANLDTPTHVTVSGDYVNLPATQVVKISGDNVVVTSGNVLARISGETIINNPMESQKIDDGTHYSVSYVDSDADTTSGGIIYAVFPTSGEYHVVFETSVDGAGLMELWENAVVTSAGTALFAYNNNRTSNNSSIVNWFHSPLEYESGTGNLIWQGRINASSLPQAAGGQAESERKWIFQSGTVLLLYRPDADNKIASFTMEYYEVA